MKAGRCLAIAALLVAPGLQAETLRDACWLWGHETGAVDGTNNIWGLDVGREYVPMADAARSLGLWNLNVVRWDRPGRSFRETLKGLKRITWPVSGLAPLGDGRYASVGYDELADWCLGVADEMPNVTGLDLDDFFVPTGGTVVVETASGSRPCCATRFPYAQLLELRRRTHERQSPLELRVVAYDELFEKCDPRTLQPVLEQVDAVTYWTWKARNIPKMGENLVRLRRLAPNRRIDVGIYLWDFGDAREMPLKAIREQLDVALDLWRRGEIHGLVFLCSSICNRPLPAVDYVRDWLARHGDESRVAESRPATNAEKAFSLLRRWCDALVSYQVKAPDDPRVKGALLCPACAIQHGRVCDMVYPMVYLWTRTDDPRYLAAARDAVAWSRHNLTDLGGARLCNDFQNRWWGISVFSQCAVGKTLLAFGDKLPADVRADWRKWFDLQTEFVARALDEDGVFNVNYSAALCEALAVAWKLTGESRYLERSHRQAAALVRYLQPDGMLAGEKHPPTYVSPRGYRAVDLGYNLEESIPALYHYAELAGDEPFAQTVDRMAMGALEFVLPDGAIDNSAGSRACKWTYYGSRTSDGALPAFAHMAKRGIPGASRAIARHLALLERCTSAESGLLTGGLSYDEAGESACVHHSFAHAKSLVDLLLSGCPAEGPDASLPRECAYGLKEFPSFGTTLAAVGPWRATFTLNETHHVDGGTMAGGGSLTLLWHDRMGPVLAATMAMYATLERENMQEQRNDSVTRSMMPRIESDAFTSAADPEATADASFSDGRFAYRAKGELTDSSGSKSGLRYGHEFRLSDDGLLIHVRCAGRWRYVLPIVASGNETVRFVKGDVRIVRKDGSVVIRSNGRISLEKTERGERAFTPVAGLLTAYLLIEPTDEGTLDVELRIEP